MAEEVRSRCYSRVGLLGNPSDGYHGKVISFALKNFFCEVTMKPSDSIEIVPHLQHDGYHHASLEGLSRGVDTQGYTGGLHLLLAACKVFRQHCKQEGIHLLQKGFTASYETSIPRQCGLSGSSAIVLAALDCLIKFYGVGDRIKLQVRPALALAAESELGITAGLQDRVIQTYGGLLYMDFDERIMLEQGQGRYKPLDFSKLPDLYVIYSQDPSNSGKIHSNVKERWQKGETLVRDGMQAIAALAQWGRKALEKQDWQEVGRLIDANFGLRKSIFGEDVIGAPSLRMVDIVRSEGGCAKLTGSGGAVVALFPLGSSKAIEDTASKCKPEGYIMVKAEIAAFAPA